MALSCPKTERRSQNKNSVGQQKKTNKWQTKSTMRTTKPVALSQTLKQLRENKYANKGNEITKPKEKGKMRRKGQKGKQKRAKQQQEPLASHL